MAFEIGDKVLTTTGLYMSGEWRERGLKGKIVDTPAVEGGVFTVKFKGIEELRFVRPEYLILRKKRGRPFKVGDTVALKSVVHTTAGAFEAGADAEVVGVIPDSNLVEIKFISGTEITVAEDVLTKTEAVEDEPADPDFANEELPDLHEVKDNPEVQAALAMVLERIEEIKALLTQGPRNEVHISVHPSSGLTSEEVSELLREEEPAPEPIFKKAKEVVPGDLLYTEGGAYDKVTDVQTKDSGYTSLFGSWGNKIAQVPSGRVVQVLEEVA